VALQIYAMGAEGAVDPVGMGLTALAAYLVVGFVAWLVERGPAVRGA